jgi:hypothetical protein
MLALKVAAATFSAEPALLQLTVPLRTTPTLRCPCELATAPPRPIFFRVDRRSQAKIQRARMQCHLEAVAV